MCCLTCRSCWSTFWLFAWKYPLYHCENFIPADPIGVFDWAMPRRVGALDFFRGIEPGSIEKEESNIYVADLQQQDVGLSIKNSFQNGLIVKGS